MQSNLRPMPDLKPDLTKLSATVAPSVATEPASTFKPEQVGTDSKALQPFKDAAKAGSVIGLLVEAITNSMAAEKTRDKRKKLESQIPDLQMGSADMNIPWMGK